MFYIGIDIGGMSVKGGVVDENGNILHKQTFKTKIDCSNMEFVKDIKALIFSLLEMAKFSLEQIKGIGVGFPGSIDVKNGIVRHCCNIDMDNFAFVENLSKMLGGFGNIQIENDANVAVLAERAFGACKNCDDVVMITIGTGIGTGIVSNGNLISGYMSAGGEGGHMVIKKDGKKCGCGRRGCFEVYASATALMELAKEKADQQKDSLLFKNIMAKGIDGKIVFDSASQGDNTAKAVLDEYFDFVAEGMANFLNIFRPQMFVLGGGISAQKKNLTMPIQKKLEKLDYSAKYNPKYEIVTAQLGNNAGIIGAVALFRK